MPSCPPTAQPVTLGDVIDHPYHYVDDTLDVSGTAGVLLSTPAEVISSTRIRMASSGWSEAAGIYGIVGVADLIRLGDGRVLSRLQLQGTSTVLLERPPASLKPGDVELAHYRALQRQLDAYVDLRVDVYQAVDFAGVPRITKPKKRPLYVAELPEVKP